MQFNKVIAMIEGCIFCLTVYIAAIKYSFAQADEILPKTDVFKQYYLITETSLLCA